MKEKPTGPAQVESLKPLVLCLGNEIVSDDGFGPEVARRVHEDATLKELVDVVSVALAGFYLLDLLQGRSRVLIVDALAGSSFGAPGTLHFFPADTMVPSHNLVGSHQLSLPVALELGRELGYRMPKTIDVLGCVAENLLDLKEVLTPEVEKAVGPAADVVYSWSQGKVIKQCSAKNLLVKPPFCLSPG